MRKLFLFPKSAVNSSPQEAPDRKQRGQVAIFVALIFQVLFVFFAMLVNVGLLVHHKINLQNSVDLAAYYGAMKQAEVMNVIAHSNYQIWQSYKLLVFRYRQIGSFGNDVYTGRAGSPNQSASDTPSAINNPSFCVAYAPFEFMEPTENYCRHSGDGQGLTINKPSPPTFSAAASIISAVAGLLSFATMNVAATNAVNAAITKGCLEKNALSYYELENFIYAWKRDISTRKKLILGLANQLSKQTNDFTDLDGQPASNGITKTFTKNLTYQNLQSYNSGTGSIKIFNSMGVAGPGSYNPVWLQEINIFPAFKAFISQDCNNSSIQYAPYYIYGGVPPAITSDPNVGATISQIDGLIQEVDPNSATNDQKLFSASLGFEKNPWYVPYVGVHAEASPQIPFSPFGTIKLQATAYAKVFGGTIGPWYGSTWPSGSPMSNGASPVEAFQKLPGRMTGAPPTLAEIQTPQWDPDFVRYIGDKVGTASNLNEINYAKIFSQFPASGLSLRYWTHLVDPNDDLVQIGANGDMLAWPNQGANAGSAGLMRSLETAAIAPDQRDVAYYSIEPNYYDNYYLRLSPRQSTDLPFIIRGDLGQRANDATLKSYSIKDQIRDTLKLAGYDVVNQMSFYVNSPAEMLTSWKGMAPDNPVMDTVNNFGKCGSGAGPNNFANDSNAVPDGSPAYLATTGNCVAGGRVGYSVKFVDPDFFNNPSPLGGSGTSGTPANPPPQNWF